MQEGMNFDTEQESGSVDHLQPEQFLEAQYRKTELRRLYRDTDAADRVSKLMRAIEQDVIPRLVSVHRKAPVVAEVPRAPRGIDSEQVARFAQVVLGHEKGVEPPSVVAEVRANGISVEHIYLDLLAPTARYVGAMWDDDRCTFLEVTMALGILHRLMLSLSADFRFEIGRIDPARRVLLVQTAGGQHSFGLQMVAEFFKRGSWFVDMTPMPNDKALGRMVQAHWFTVIGFSVACEPMLDDLAETIRTVRRLSSNPKAGILVGGAAFIDHPEYVSRVGADGMAADAIHAVLEAERFVLHTV